MQKVIKRKGDKLYVKWKGYDNSFNSWIDTTGIIISELVISHLIFTINILEVELDFSNYAAKSDLKNATDVDTSQFVNKDDFRNL